MAKLTKFKAQQVEFPTHYEVEETNRGNNKIKSIVPAFGNIRENGTPETEEIYDGLQLGNVHTLQANKTTNLNIDYYVCNLDGLNEFGVNNDLKLRINVDSKNTNSTTKLRLNNNDYTILKEYNGNLKQIEAGDFKPNKTYELTYNGSQFVVINVDSRLNEIMGLEFGGNIQDTGDKVRGKCYFDNVTKFYYECIEDNSLTYNDSGKFRAISNKPILDKLEKLCEVKKLNDTEIDSRIPQYFSGAKLFKKGNVVTFNGLIDRNLNVANSPLAILFNLPFKPIDDYIWVSPIFTIRKNGNFEVGTYANFNRNKITEPAHLSFTYICE